MSCEGKIKCTRYKTLDDLHRVQSRDVENEICKQKSNQRKLSSKRTKLIVNHVGSAANSKKIVYRYDSALEHFFIFSIFFSAGSVFPTVSYRGVIGNSARIRNMAKKSV